MLVVIKLVYTCSGRFDVWDDHDGESPSWHGSPRESRKSDETRKEREDREQRRGDDKDRKEERDPRRPDERSEKDEIRRVGSERILSSIRGLTTLDERDRDRFIFLTWFTFYLLMSHWNAFCKLPSLTYMWDW